MIVLKANFLCEGASASNAQIQLVLANFSVCWNQSNLFVAQGSFGNSQLSELTERQIERNEEGCVCVWEGESVKKGK